MAEQEHRRSGRTTHVIAVEEIPTGAKSSAFNLAKLSEKINLEKVKFPLEVIGNFSIYFTMSGSNTGFLN